MTNITPDPMQEVYIQDRIGAWHRVYRGRRQAEVDWKLEHHAEEGHISKVVKPGELAETGGSALADGSRE